MPKERDTQSLLAEQFAQLTVIQHLPSSAAAREMGLSLAKAAALRLHPDYKRIKRKMQKAIEQYTAEQMHENVGRIKKLQTPAIDRLEGILYESESEDSVLKAANSVLDRTGMPRTIHNDTAITIQLDEATRQALIRGMREAQAIELQKTDWSYATTRPLDDPRNGQPEREATPRLAIPRQEIDVLHGQGGDRLSGSGPRPARYDGSVDSTPDPQEAGLSPSRSSENESLDG